MPLTVKFRAGIREDDLNFVELGRICEGEGVDAVALHPRTAKQMYTGRADWSRIARLKEAVRIPVVGQRRRGRRRRTPCACSARPGATR